MKPDSLNTLIHFGSNHYNPKMIRPIKNREWCKPSGGLWTSPEDSKYGWKEWCKAEDFRDCNEHNCFKLNLNEEAKVYVINNVQDILKAPLVKIKYKDMYSKQFIDFELLSKEYDAIWLTEEGQRKTRNSEPDLYGWDCETVLILNPNCVTEQKELLTI